MKNSDKAKEIIGGNWMAFNKEYSAALQMAEWKDQQHAKECESLVGLAVKEARQVLINKACEWLEKYMESLGYIDEWCRNGEDAFRKAMVIKDSLTTELTWHKASEELPEETCEVLICWETIKHERKWTQLAIFRRHADNHEIWYFEDSDDVVVTPDYWMPIPELPKED